MLIRTIMLLYRFISVVLICTPMVLNLIDTGEIIDSLIYIPLLTLVVSLLLIFIDHKLEQALMLYQKNHDTRIISSNIRAF